MDRALDYAAKSTDPSAQFWRAEQRKHYDEIPVRRIEALSVYDDAFDDFALRRAGLKPDNRQQIRQRTDSPRRAPIFQLLSPNF
jgi:hypothetical protein